MAEDKKLTVGIVGLGLIGGSLAKAAKEGTPHTILGMDLDPSVVLKARLLDAIDGELKTADLKRCDILLVAIHPEATLDFLRDSAAMFNPKGMVIDCCGIKREVCKLGEELAKKYGFTFIGGHPMAGKERSGFEHSARTLFSRASMILVPPAGIELEKIGVAKQFFLSLGFGRITITTAQEHDRVIAYTSQLAHILSSAYIKSDTAMSHTGISAGSFRDMTRVATLQPEMWAELCLENRQPMLNELNGLIDRLAQYRDAIQQNDYEKLRQLLHEGSQRKAEVDKLKA